MFCCRLQRFRTPLCSHTTTRLATTVSHQTYNLPHYIPPAESFLPYKMFEIQEMVPTPPPDLSACRYTRYRLPSVMMRSGTSKGLFLHRHHLPSSVSDWAPILLSAMGSRGNDLRQLDGVGGGTSTTSKVSVVSKSNRPGTDVDYTFVQVAVGKDTVDMTGNCGNMCAGVAAFALDEGLVEAELGQTEASPELPNLSTMLTNTGTYS
jgi:hypothetical protein